MRFHLWISYWMPHDSNSVNQINHLKEQIKLENDVGASREARNLYETTLFKIIIRNAISTMSIHGIQRINCQKYTDTKNDSWNEYRHGGYHHWLLMIFNAQFGEGFFSRQWIGERSRFITKLNSIKLALLYSLKSRFTAVELHSNCEIFCSVRSLDF